MLKNRSLQEGILTQETLLFPDLQALLSGEILALRIPKFYCTTACLQLLAAFQDLALFDHYRMAKDMGVKRIGMSLFETENQPEHLHRYYKEAKETMKKLDLICSPHPNPLGVLFQQLENVWPHGALVENIHGYPMQPGTVRMFKPGAHSGLPPHHDMLTKDVPDSSRAQQMQCQLAANIYLGVPERGGELELWDFCPTEEEYGTLFTGHHDFMDRELLPTKPVRIRPIDGELILMSSRNVHAVEPSFGSRLSMGCFIGYYGSDHPLTYWA